MFVQAMEQAGKLSLRKFSVLASGCLGSPGGQLIDATNSLLRSTSSERQFSIPGLNAP